MKLRRLYACLCITVFSMFTHAQEQSFIAPLANQSVLLDAYVSDYMVVVGERGHVLISDDGVNFSQLNVPTQSTLTAVSIIGNKIWATGHDAVIIHSADKGQNWTVQYYAPEMERPFLDILFFDDQEGIAIGAYGLFYRTEDGGNSWRAERHAELLDPMDQEYLNEIRLESEEFYLQELDSILPHLNRVSENGQQLYMAGEMGLLATSTDKGRSWKRLPVDYFGSFFDISSINNGQSILAVGLRGNAFISNDGESWQSIQTCTSATFNSLYQKSENQWVAVGNNGVVTQFSLPLTDAVNASPNQCEELSDINTTQTIQKSALINVVSFNDLILAVSAEGIQPLNL